MYPNPRVAEFIGEHFIPVRIHVKEQPAMWKRFSIRWTPTVLVLAPDGTEVRRIEGFLPVEELLGQLELALGEWAVARKDWKEAERWFGSSVDQFPHTEAAPEGLYWRGVARYSESHDPKELKELGQEFRKRYQGTGWAKRASVW